MAAVFSPKNNPVRMPATSPIRICRENVTRPLLHSREAGDVSHVRSASSEPKAERERQVLAVRGTTRAGRGDASRQLCGCGDLRSPHVVIPGFDVELALFAEREPDACANVESEIPAAARSEHRFYGVGAADVVIRITDHAGAGVPGDLDFAVIRARS